MKTLRKIGLIAVAVVVAIKLLPATLVLGGVVAGGGGAAGAGRLPDGLRFARSGLAADAAAHAHLASRCWPVMGLIALVKKPCGRTVAA